MPTRRAPCDAIFLQQSGSMSTFTVTKAHVASFPEPFVGRRGERVVVGAEDTEYPGWIRSSTIDGRSGWVPRSLLRISAGEGELLADYDATELTAEPGDAVEVLAEESGWVWCLNLAGRSGWIPKACIRQLP